MNFIALIFTGFALSMDAFAVSITKGMTIKNLKKSTALKMALAFGLFQGGMPLLGWILGISFKNYIEAIDHWIAFILLVFIGINMLKEAFGNNPDNCNDSVDLKTMIVLAIATSIDALAVGITFAFLKTNIVLASLVIGIITFVVCIIGVKIGNKFGDKYERNAETVGGLILIFMGIKILFEHLGII